jgi:hypothetical protein
MPAKITYGELFTFLRSLGFVGQPTGKPDWAWRHAATDTLLVYSFMHAETDQVANADMVSTERFLLTKHLIGQPLRDAIQIFTDPSNR